MSELNVHASGKIPMQEIAALPPEKAHALMNGIASVVTASQGELDFPYTKEKSIRFISEMKKANK